MKASSFWLGKVERKMLKDVDEIVRNDQIPDSVIN
jgi:hypothetical protein